ncbi:MAG: PilN domain-containing protein [Candidatus Nitrohelix vancouverensis]|uniref:PilN domain-containing protein n=1 Tax=Candidatus Nitrohelix vancouverensis TaxID=2705534 RepID=A0A7T0C143_9BACT|nr:MAG: PilN domain-containing protein [Candidatus Nitrohelix vancouverensis]
MKKLSLPKLNFKLPAFGRFGKRDPKVEQEEDFGPGRDTLGGKKTVEPGYQAPSLINLHDYRQELVKVQIQKRIMQACSIPLAFVFLLMGNWIVELDRVDMIKADIKNLEKQVAALESDYQAVKKMQEQIRRSDEIVSGIQTLRHSQFETTRILNDLYSQVPDAIWLTAVEQKNWHQLKKEKVPYILFEDPSVKDQRKKKKKSKDEDSREDLYEFIEIRGMAIGEEPGNDVAKLTMNLEKLPYFEKVFIFKTGRKQIATVYGDEFIIYCFMPVSLDPNA